ncbi:hypothetical protein C0J52_22878, partial [Blattella germanica]
KDYEISADIATNKYKEVGTLGNRARVPVGLKISEYHLMLKGLKSEYLQKLKASIITSDHDLESVKSSTLDPFEYLRLMLEDLKIDADFSGIESRNEGGQQVILLSVATVPEMVVFGSGATEEEACRIAAINAINHLILMNT